MNRNKIRVAQFGLGPIGLSCLHLLARKNWVEVVGGVDVRSDLIGRSLAEVTGEAGLGEALVYESFAELNAATPVDAVLHTAGSRASVSLAQMEPMVEAGLAIVSSCEELLFPSYRAPAETLAADEHCRRTGARILGTGINPGFVLDVLPVCLSGVCAEVRGVYGERVVNASSRRQPLQKKVGSGMDPQEFVALGKKGLAGHAGFHESLLLIAHSLGWDVGPIEDSIDAIVADYLIETEHFRVEPGQTAGLHQIVKASTADGKAIHLDLKMYQGAKDPHDFVRLDSSPPVEARVEGGIAGDLATVAALVNALPRIMVAAPGLRLMTDIAIPSCPSRLNLPQTASAQKVLS